MVNIVSIRKWSLGNILGGDILKNNLKAEPLTEEKYEVGKKETWLLDTSFEWFKGNAEIEKDIVIVRDVIAYGLRDVYTWKAFKELADCVPEPGFIYKPKQKREYGKYFDQIQSREWIYFLHPRNSLNEHDLHRLLEWVSRYGLPYPELPYRYKVNKDTNSCRMRLDDLLVIANLVSLSWKLFESTRTKDTTFIKNIANLVSTETYMTLEDSQSHFLAFGLTERAPRIMTIRIRDCEKVPDLQKWSRDAWRRTVNLWLGRISEPMIEIQIKNRFTREVRIRPVLTINSFVSWLWLHFLAHIGVMEGTTNTKICQDCGTEYSDSRSVRCPPCNLKHKNEIKSRSKFKSKSQKVNS